MRVSATPPTSAMRPPRGRRRVRYGPSRGAGGRAPGPPGPPAPPEPRRPGGTASTSARPVADTEAGTRARPVGVVMDPKVPTGRDPAWSPRRMRHEAGTGLHPFGEVPDRAAH